MILETRQELLIPFDLDTYLRYKPQLMLDDGQSYVRIETTNSPVRIKGTRYPIIGVEHYGEGSMEEPLLFTAAGVSYSNSPNRQRLVMKTIQTTEFINIFLDADGTVDEYRFSDYDKAVAHADNVSANVLGKFLVVGEKVITRSH